MRATDRTTFPFIEKHTCCYIRIGASSNFPTNLLNLDLVLLVCLVPWTAINLIDFYVIHKGKYDIASIFKLTVVFMDASARNLCGLLSLGSWSRFRS